MVVDGYQIYIEINKMYKLKMIGGGMVEKKKVKNQNAKVNEVSHVGGITDNIGGVDPSIDEDLIRLSGGP